MFTVTNKAPNMTSSADEALHRINELANNTELSITKLSDPILGETTANDQQHGNRNSNASSTDNGGNPTPASLEADLTHYKDLFTKLRFSYVEQVTKRSFSAQWLAIRRCT